VEILCGYLYIVKDFLNEHLEIEICKILYDDVRKMINETDFSKLYCEKTKLFSIGFNLEENKLTDSYYDFLASEARQASLVAIAKRDVSAKHWNALSRTITTYKGYKGLISWTGTAFEYLMPNINLKTYEGSLTYESSKFAIMSQKEYCKKLNVPWGISESAYNLRDLNYNYQYKAFGIPWLGLKRGLEYDIVISPYSTFLALQDGEESAISNIEKLKKIGAVGKYGFFESIDFTSSRLKQSEKYAIVRTYMAHHQGLILNSINNVINDKILQKRFNNNPEIEAVQILLEERMPKDMIITKEKKERPERIKTTVDSGYIETIINTPDVNRKNYNVIANENYKIVIDDFGEGYSQYKETLINRYKPLYEIPQGIFFRIKNLKNNRIFDFHNSTINFAQDKTKFVTQEGAVKITKIITLNPNKPVEIRRLEIENLGSNEEILEVIADFVPVLSEANAEYAHPSFNNMFLKFEKEENNIIIERHSRNLDKFMYAAVCLYTENDQIVDNSFEINKEKYLGRGIYSNPIGLSDSKIFSNNLNYTINKILAMKQIIKLQPSKKVNLNLLISLSENRDEAIKNLNDSKKEEDILKIFEISKARCEEEMKYLQINSNSAKKYQELLNYILNPSYIKNLNLDINKEYEINSLWKFGISGDIPILMVKVRNLDDVENVQEIIEAYMYYRIKMIYLDLVIINEEVNFYERYVRDSIEGIILDKQLVYLKNIKSGIFVLNGNELEEDDIKTIELKSKIIIDASLGGIEEFIKEKKKFKSRKINHKPINYEEEILSKNEEDLLFYNGYGGFSQDGKEYKFAVNKDNKLPSSWSNIIANKMFGLVTTENMQDVIWNKNSRLNRLTAWNNDTVQNIPSQIIYVKNQKNNKVWTLNPGIIPSSNYYYVTYGLGYAKYKNVSDGILQQTDIFVPNETSQAITKIRFKNTSSEEKDLKLIIYFKTVLGEDEAITTGNIYVEKNKNIIFMKNILAEPEFRKIAYITSNLEINSFTKSKNEFFGNGGILEPDGLFCENFDSKSGIGNCVGIEIKIFLKEYEEKYLCLTIGQENDIYEIKKQQEYFENIENIDKALNDVNRRWSNFTNTLNIKTPDDKLNILLNGWLIYQTICCRIWAKTAFYQSGGAIGFRDQLQDCLGMKFIDIQMLKEYILKCAMHQFIQGDVLHWWHEETKKGIRTKFSDDLLWLPYSVYEYVNITGEYEFLNEEIEYLQGDELKDGVDEEYSQFYKLDFKESLYLHCIRAIDRACNFGENGFPLIGSGDWNDGFSNIGTKGKGESIWLGFFLYDVLNKFAKICEKQNDMEHFQKYNTIKEKLKHDLNTKGWDGRWFKRAITDNGEALGSISSSECKIDGISQSWAVISEAGDNDKKYISMQELENNLVDRENKIIKLFWPAFESSEINPGYIKAYPKGIRENGGQYTHRCNLEYNCTL
jgi:cellobiose phosphorylase